MIAVMYSDKTAVRKVGTWSDDGTSWYERRESAMVGANGTSRTETVSDDRGTAYVSRREASDSYVV